MLDHLVTLRECFDTHGCDKGKRHGYERLYEPIFAPLRNSKIRILEIGILSGASISVWVEYFPHAEVIGIDTFERVKPQDVAVLKHPNVSWWKLDSTKEAPDVEVDIVIDDGYHTPDAQLATFQKYFPLLRSGGLYFIEDIDPKLGLGLFEQLPGAIHHDLRRGYNRGSYVIEVRK